MQEEVAQEQPVERRSHVLDVGREVFERAAHEQAAHRGGALEQPPLGRRQAVDACGDQRLQRVRDPLYATALPLGEHPDRLLDEERVPLGLREHGVDVDRDAELGGERGDELGALGERQRLELERHRADTAAAPRRPYVEQFRPGEAEQQERRLAHPGGEVLDQLEQRLLAPVDVLEDEHERLRLGELLAEARTAHAISCWARSASTASRTPTASPSRSATASSSQQARSFSYALSSGSSSEMPADAFTISAIGHHVTPSPYGRQRPLSTVAPSSPSRNSRARRLLPTPGSP